MLYFLTFLMPDWDEKANNVLSNAANEKIPMYCFRMRAWSSLHFALLVCAKCNINVHNQRKNDFCVLISLCAHFVSRKAIMGNGMLYHDCKLMYCNPLSLCYDFRMIQLILMETYENSALFDFTYIVVVWIAFLPTCLSPLIYFLWSSASRHFA